MKAKPSLAVGLALVAFAAGGSAASKSAGFSARVDNPWYPLTPGSTYVYQGVKDGEPSREVMTVTRRKRVIDGAPCVVIQDLLYLRGRLEERTTDWYTQDAKGNVWYFGEKTAELTRTGRSRHGRHLALQAWPALGLASSCRPPAPGHWARQEYYKGQAEDHFKVLRMGVPVTVPYISTTHALLTREWTPLEPGVIDHKYYVRGIGTVLEQTVKGPTERNELVSFRRGS